MTHLCQNGDWRGAWSSEACLASRPDHIKRVLARVPGIGLLNRTFESWGERHEVQLLRGLPATLLWRSQVVRRRIVNPVIEGSNPSATANLTDPELE